MMNNCWYVVKPEIVQGVNNAVPEIVFTHPVEPGTSDGGWLKSPRNYRSRTQNKPPEDHKNNSREKRSRSTTEMTIAGL
jgi:nitrate reductase (NAD(P)H)